MAEPSTVGEGGAGSADTGLAVTAPADAGSSKTSAAVDNSSKISAAVENSSGAAASGENSSVAAASGENSSKTAAAAENSSVAAAPGDNSSSSRPAKLPPPAAASRPETARAPMQTSISRFVKSNPKLERKHSSGDLHSRLKTRKVLGVGATDNGDVHRSKISQVLGHNEHLYVRFPRGLLGWYLMVSCGLGLQGGLLVVSPAWAAHLHLLAAGPTDLPALSLVSRGYGVTLIGLSHLLYAVYSTSDKVIIRSGLGVLVLTDVCALGAQLIHMFQEGGWSRWCWLHIGLRGLSAGVSLLYLNLSRNYYAGNYYAGIRKSPTPAPALDLDARKKSL